MVVAVYLAVREDKGHYFLHLLVVLEVGVVEDVEEGVRVDLQHHHLGLVEHVHSSVCFGIYADSLAGEGCFGVDAVYVGLVDEDYVLFCEVQLG